MSLDRTLTRACPGAERRVTIRPAAAALRGLNQSSGTAGPKVIGIIGELLASAAKSERIIAEQQARIARLEALSVTDDLTGLVNRRGFRLALDQALHHAARHDERGLLAILDLDGFKRINDRFGHQAGDKVLRAVGDHLRRSVRGADWVARLGGDEFAVLFVRADCAAGRRRALALKRSLNQMTVPDLSAQLRVSASIGIHPYGPNSIAGDLLRWADEAMYRIKRQRSVPQGLPLSCPPTDRYGF